MTQTVKGSKYKQQSEKQSKKNIEEYHNRPKITSTVHCNVRGVKKKRKKKIPEGHSNSLKENKLTMPCLKEKKTDKQ